MAVMAHLIDIDEAWHILRTNIRPLEPVRMPLADAVFRTLAQPVVSDVDDPPFDKAVMDGYAVRAADTTGAPVELRLVGHVRAGGPAPADRPLASGEAVQVNTGAPMPPGADAVVRVEVTERREATTAPTAPEGAGDRVLIREAVPPGKFITPRGSHARAAEVVVPAGARLTPPAMGTSAAAGAATVMVYRRPRVAVLATGDELVPVDVRPSGSQIRNSNEHLLSGLITAAHADCTRLGAVGDDQAKLGEAIEQGLRSDVLCITGGVSMGAYDFVPEVLTACGVTVHIRKMAIKPGRPVIFGMTPGGGLVFALPGNPASAFVGFNVLVRPALALLEGAAPAAAFPRLFSAVLQGTIQPTGNRRTYVPARADVGDNGQWYVEPIRWHGSGDVFGLASATALIERPPDAPAAGSGEVVSVLLLESRWGWA